MTLERQTALQLRYAGQMHFESSCSRKLKFPDLRAAKDGARAMKRKMHKQFSAYRCPYCDQWHIGGRRKDLEHRGDIETAGLIDPREAVVRGALYTPHAAPDRGGHQ